MSQSTPEDSVPSTPPASDNNLLRGITGDDNAPLPSPVLTNLTLLGTSPRNSFPRSSGVPLVSETEKGLEEDEPNQPEPRKPLFKRRVFWLAAVAALVVVALAVVLPLYFTVIKPKNATSNGSNNPDSTQPTPTNNPDSPKGLTTGGDGSTITTENGTQFTYHNPFGGFCA